MREEQRLTDARQPDPFSALVTLKSELARQYAEGADHNRQINKRRERLRSVAGLAALASVAMTVFLVATAYAHYLSSHDAVHEECDCHAATGFLPADAPDNRSRADAVGLPASQPAPSPPPMRVVTKGWWTLREEQKAPVDVENAREDATYPANADSYLPLGAAEAIAPGPYPPPQTQSFFKEEGPTFLTNEDDERDLR